MQINSVILKLKKECDVMGDRTSIFFVSYEFEKIEDNVDNTVD